jgi:hypothetical protein
LLVAACSSSSANPSSTVDASSAHDSGHEKTDGGRADAREGDASECNTLVDTSAAVRAQLSSTAPPAATGGDIQTYGTYVLTSFVQYSSSYGDGGTSPVVFDTTLAIEGSKWQIAAKNRSVFAPDDFDFGIGATFTASGTKFSLEETCPASNVSLAHGTFTYTGTTDASVPSLVLYVDVTADGGTYVDELTFAFVATP